MGLLDKISGLFGKKPTYSGASAADAQEQKKQPSQVYPGPECETPEWAREMAPSKLMDACQKNAKCKFTLNVELKKIMSTRRGFDGNLIAEYDGIAGGCGALKTFGLTIAKREGQVTPYRYVDLNHIYACCCDRFRRCPFYQMASGEAKDLESRQRRI